MRIYTGREQYLCNGDRVLKRWDGLVWLLIEICRDLHDILMTLIDWGKWLTGRDNLDSIFRPDEVERCCCGIFQQRSLTYFCYEMIDENLTEIFSVIPPHLKCVATPPCEILMSEKNSNNLKHSLWLTLDLSQRDVDVVGRLTTTLLQIYCWVCFEIIFKIA